MIEDERVEYMIMYIPVEVDTYGGTPIEIIRGLKMLPPPSPRAPPTHPPMKAPKINYDSCTPLNLISVGASPLPVFSFKACSRRLMKTPIMVREKANTMKSTNMPQSRPLHLSKPSIMLGAFLEPLIKVITSEIAIALKANKCFLH